MDTSLLVLAAQYAALGIDEASLLHALLACSASNYTSRDAVFLAVQALLRLNRQPDAYTVLLRHLDVLHPTFLASGVSLTHSQLALALRACGDELSAVEPLLSVQATPDQPPVLAAAPPPTAQLAAVHFALLDKRLPPRQLLAAASNAAEDPTNLALLPFLTSEHLPPRDAAAILRRLAATPLPHHIDFLYAACLAALRADVTAARDVFSAMRTAAPALASSPLAHFLMALAAYQARCYDEARSHLDAALPAAWREEVLRVSVLHHLGMLSASSDAYSDGLCRIAERRLDGALRTLGAGGSAEEQVAAGHAAALQGEHLTAARHYERALARAPGSVAVRVYLAQALLAAGHLQRAEEELTTVADGGTDGCSWDVEAAFGELRYRQGRFEEALAQYRSARQKAAGVGGTTQHILFGNEGHCLRKLSRLDEAIVCFGQCLGGNDFVGYAGIGWCCWRMGEAAACVDALQKALALRPDVVCERLLEAVQRA